jgi:hypothetical protein
MTRYLSPIVPLGRHWRVQWEFKPADLWVGVYWCNHGGFIDVWVCLVPMLPIHFWSLER